MMAFGALFFGVYFCDVITKVGVRRFLPLGADVRILPFFSLTHVQNTGVAFGLFPDRNGLFVGIGFLMMVLLVVWAVRLRREDRFSSLVLAAVLGGACGNLTDRLLFGRVTDFLDFYWGVHHWPAFNVADSTICVGAGLLLYRNLFHPK